MLLSMGFPGGSDGKESACNVGDPGLIPGLGRSLGEGRGNPPQYSYLENPMDNSTCYLSGMKVGRQKFGGFSSRWMGIVVPVVV